MQQPKLEEGNDAAHHGAEESAQESVQQPPIEQTSIVAFNGAEQHAEEFLQQPSLNDPNTADHDIKQPGGERPQHQQSNHSTDPASNDVKQLAEEHVDGIEPQGNGNAKQHHAEPSIEASAQQTPKAANDSEYNSPQDETIAWEKIMAMKEREHENEVAAMQDLHDDEMKDLRGELNAEIRTKEYLQKRVKKEALAKKDLQQQLDTIQGEHRAAVEASASKVQDFNEKEKEALDLRARLQEMETGFLDKEKHYLDTLKSQEEQANNKEEEVIELRLRIYDMNTELLNKRASTDAEKPQGEKFARPSTEWEAWYHHAFEEGQRWRTELEICKRQKEQAMAIAEDHLAQLKLAKTANDKLNVDLAAKQKHMESDARYHEQIRGQNYDLQKRINEFIVDVATLKYQNATAEQEAAAEVKHLTRKLDNRTADLSALEATRAEWQANAEGLLLTRTHDVTSDAMMFALAKRFELALNENESLKQRMVVEEQAYDALRAKLGHSRTENDGLSRSLAEKARDVTGLQDKIHDLETEILRRDMNEEADKRAEPGYLQAMEEVAWLRNQLKDKALEYAGSIANLAAADRPRKAIHELQQICGQVSAHNDALQTMLYEERREFDLNKNVMESHIYGLTLQIANAGSSKQQAINFEKAWDRIRELERYIEHDRIARMNSDAVTLEIRAQLEDQMVQKESQIDQCLEEIRRLRAAASEDDEDVVDSEALAAQLGQARRAALQNRQEHVAEVRELKDLVEKLSQRMMRLERALSAAGSVVEEAYNAGQLLKAECKRVLEQEDHVSESETVSPLDTTHGIETGNVAVMESESDDEEEGNTSRSDDAESDADPHDEARSPSHAGTDVDTGRHSSESSTTITVRRFVMRSLAEAGTRTRVLGEPISSSPTVTPTLDANPPKTDDGKNGSPDVDSGSDDRSGDLHPLHPPAIPSTSQDWVTKHRPFRYGEPTEDDQFAKGTIHARL